MSDEMDFSAARAGALDALSNSTPAETPAPTPTPEPAAVTPSPEPTATPASEVATPAKTYKVKVDGEEMEVPEDELLNGYSRTAKFTKNMMQLAEQRKAFEAQVQQAQEREKAINEFFRDPQNIVRYYESVTGQKLTPAQAQAAIAANTPPVPGADEFATVSTVQQLAAKEAADKAKALEQQVAERLQQSVQQTQRWTQEQIQKAQIEAEQSRKAVEYHGEINSTVSSLLDQFPVLKAVDDIENILCFDAQRMDPSSLVEAKAALLNVAKARAEKLEAQFTERMKQTAVQQTKLSTQGIEPPGGTAPQTPPTSFKLGDKALSAAVADYIAKASKK
jgi:hypothetical protein